MIWYGKEAAYDTFVEAKVKAATLLKKNPNMSTIEPPSAYQLVGDVGVISIKGSLIQGDAGWLQLFGVTGYDNIASALIEGIKDKGAKSIVLNIDSTGGSAKGVRQIGDLIKNVSEVKHTSVFADTIDSAAYWLGSAGGHITLDEMGEAGSLGALIVHTDYSKQLEDEGIKKTIIRAGEFKALANPYEPLSEAALAELQQKVDDARDLFINAVADNRNSTPSTVENTMGKGRVFTGVRALQVGLVDQIGTFESALAYSKDKAKAFKPTKSAKVA